MFPITLFLSKGGKFFKMIFIPGATSPNKWRELMVAALTDKNNIREFKKADDMKMVIHFGFSFNKIVNEYSMMGFLNRLIGIGLKPHLNQVMLAYFECRSRKAVADKLRIKEGKLKPYIEQILHKLPEKSIDELIMNLM